MRGGAAIAALLLTAATVAATAWAATALAVPLTWPDLIGRPRPTGSIRINYGPSPLQYGELWLPRAKGPHPVVLMVHGGCWQSDIADPRIMHWIAGDLAQRGIAVWNIEYRGVDRPGGGYPGTFVDVATAANLLRTIGPKYRLRTDRVVAVGHSAGGHLAFWLAGRARLPRASPLRTPDPLPIHAAIGIGALPDLAAARDLPGNDCGAGGVPKLVGTGRADPFADTSAERLLPTRTALTLINGSRDKIAPPAIARAFVAKAAQAGQRVAYIEVADQGHVELIAPETPAWAATVKAIEEALGK